MSENLSTVYGVSNRKNSWLNLLWVLLLNPPGSYPIVFAKRCARVVSPRSDPMVARLKLMSLRSKKPEGEKKGHGYLHKRKKVLSPVDRTCGQARSMVVDDLKANTLVPLKKTSLANRGS